MFDSAMAWMIPLNAVIRAMAISSNTSGRVKTLWLRTRIKPKIPVLIIKPDIIPERCAGATGCALGSHE